MLHFSDWRKKKKEKETEYEVVKSRSGLPMVVLEPPESLNDLPTDDEVKKIIATCADSKRDKVMISVHAEAGTRIGELLGLRIKDVTVDQYGAVIKVDGKTGVRPIRIVKSVPYVTQWINAHPNKDELESPLWIYIHAEDTFGQPINYTGFRAILQKEQHKLASKNE